jgi:hypothetical protein
VSSGVVISEALYSSRMSPGKSVPQCGTLTTMGTAGTVGLYILNGFTLYI